MPEQQITLDDVKNFIRQITPNQDWLYIIQPGSIGDMLLTMMLSHGVQKRKNKSATVLIALERMKTLSTVCENIAGILYLPDPMIRLVQHYLILAKDHLVCLVGLNCLAKIVFCI